MPVSLLASPPTSPTSHPRPSALLRDIFVTPIYSPPGTTRRCGTGTDSLLAPIGPIRTPPTRSSSVTGYSALPFPRTLMGTSQAASLRKVRALSSASSQCSPSLPRALSLLHNTCTTTPGSAPSGQLCSASFLIARAPNSILGGVSGSGTTPCNPVPTTMPPSPTTLATAAQSLPSMHLSSLCVNTSPWPRLPTVSTIPPMPIATASRLRPLATQSLLSSGPHVKPCFSIAAATMAPGFIPSVGPASYRSSTACSLPTRLAG